MAQASTRRFYPLPVWDAACKQATFPKHLYVEKDTTIRIKG